MSMNRREAAVGNQSYCQIHDVGDLELAAEDIKSFEY
jgi:hypothetical protein